ncbi:MAG: hypothetical protein KDB27_04170 [Planctomycetales bacterium]|nr:hypothetical protein [Planctomycetales bacterium]
MATTLLATTANPQIAELENVFGEATKPIEWLVIAHNDSRMLQSLSSALNGESAAILEVSQDNWNFHKELSDTIDWALQQGDIKNLVLVGSSQAGGAESRASLATSTKEDESNYSKLLAGVNRVNDENRDAQERFASLVQQMSQIPVVHNRWSSDKLAVYGLFYRAESGLFLAYDAATDTFRPLVSN